jgi:hypothetical protein
MRPWFVEAFFRSELIVQFSKRMSGSDAPDPIHASISSSELSYKLLPVG